MARPLWRYGPGCKDLGGPQVTGTCSGACPAQLRGALRGLHRARAGGGAAEGPGGGGGPGGGADPPAAQMIVPIIEELVPRGQCTAR